jgi:hypothetical protein
MRGTISLAIIAFAITLGILVGQRLSSEALAVVVGVVLGVLASVPVSILLLVAVRVMNRRPEPEKPAKPAQPQYPPIIVVTPGGQPSLPVVQQDPGVAEGSWRPAEARPMFRVIGED